MPSKWTAADIPSLAGKLAVVTGANSGLGLETTAALAAAGATVVMGCRDAVKAEAAREALLRRTPQAKLEVQALDLADLDSVRSFASAVRTAHPRIDLLINNAGVMALPLRRTRQGFEMQIGTNHLGHFALTGQLLDALAAAGTQAVPARVVTVASLAHRYFTLGIDLGDLNYEHRRYFRWLAYGESKLANLLFTSELQRRFEKARLPVIALAAHPGVASTNLANSGPTARRSAIERGILSLAPLVAQNAAMGALPSLYAATADVTGDDYFGPGGLRETRGYPRRVGRTRAARNPATAARLWQLSEELTGVRYL